MRSRTARGDDDIDAKRSRPSIGKTREMCHARQERVRLVGTRSADHIRASGHSGRMKKAAYMAAPERFADMSDFSLAPRAPSIHGTFRHLAACHRPTSAGTVECPR